MFRDTGDVIGRVSPVKECPSCGEECEGLVPETGECFECHDNSGLAFDECGCERCVDRLVSAADFMDRD